MGLLTLAQLEAAANQEAVTEDVYCPEMKGDIRIKALRGDERETWETAQLKLQAKRKTKDMRGFRVSLIVTAAIDEAGDLLFPDGPPAWLNRLPSASLERVYAVAARLSGVSKEDEDDFEKNSERTPTDVSG